MRVSSLGVARPAYYDRNATTSQSTYATVGTGAIGPHANTQRFSYTVPAGKLAYVENMFAWAGRATAPTVTGDIAAFHQFVTTDTTSGVQWYDLINSAPVGTKTSAILTSSGMLGPGDIARAYTSDASTGGTVNYILNAKYTVFDK